MIHSLPVPLSEFHRKLLDLAGNPLMQSIMEVTDEVVLTQKVRTTPSQRENAVGRNRKH